MIFCLMFWSKQGRDPNVSTHFRMAARICLGFVLGRHGRDPNVSTHIRIAALLCYQTIKSLCACAYFVLILFNGLAPEHSRGPNMSAFLCSCL